MSDATLSAGAYLICNQKTFTLQIQHPDVSRRTTSAMISKQNEDQFKDQQIFWVEPLAHHESEDPDPGKGLVYSITSPGIGKVLDVYPESGWVYVSPQNGEPWQRWRLRKVKDPDDGEVSYNIVNVLNGKVIDIDGDKPNIDSWVNVQPHTENRLENRWEFEIPVTAFPPGWFHVQNVGTGDLLSHDYDHNPPVLLPPPETPMQSQYREQWGFQWVLLHSKCYKPTSAGERNSWYIINRLTRTRLSPHFGNMREKDIAGRDNNLEWKLTLDTSRNWKITNLATSCLLQQMNSVRGGGTEVGCSNRVFTPKDGHQSWILRPPLLYTNDEAGILPGKGISQGLTLMSSQLPPEYTSPKA